MIGSATVQLGLMAIYLALVVLSFVEHNPGKALYWTGVVVLTAGVLVMRG